MQLYLTFIQLFI